VGGVNLWSYASDVTAYEGEALSMYVQLVDRAAATDDGGPGGGRRYAPAAGATLSVTFESLDAAKVVTRFATQPYVGDASIWLANVLAGDGIRGSVLLRFVLNEGGVIHNAVIPIGLRLRSTQKA
jgi:hypothetical protein